MIKDTISLILTAKELAVFVEKKIEALEKQWPIQKEKAEQFDSHTTNMFYWSNTSLDVDYFYIKAINKEETFLNLLRKFPDNKYELFLDDIQYYGIVEDSPNVGR